MLNENHENNKTLLDHETAIPSLSHTGIIFSLPNDKNNV